MKRSWILGAWVCLLAAGCAVAPEVEQSPERLRATHGYVRVSLPQSGAYGSVTLRPLKGGEEHTVTRRPGDAGNAGLWIPAGEYQIPDLLRKDGSAYPPISIQPGRITDLGAYVTLQLGGYEYINLALSHPEAELHLQKAAERLRLHLAQPDSLRWRTDAVPSVRKVASPLTGLGLVADLLQAYERHVNKPPLSEQLKNTPSVGALYRLAAAASPPMTDEPGVGADGSLYYGAELGQVRVRRPDGQWLALDSGTLASITAVEVTAGMVVVGTSSGTVRLSKDQGKSWQEAAMASPSESVVDIDRVGSRWLVITAALTPHPQGGMFSTMTHWKFHASAGDDFSSLSLVRASSKPGPVTTFWGMAVRGIAAGGDTYYVNGFTELLKFDLRTLQSTVLNPPQAAVTRLSVSPDGRLLAAFLASGAFSKLNVSTDGGATWRALDTPSYPVYDVQFDSLDAGRASRLSVGAFSSTFEWATYDRAQDRWVKDHEAPAGCVRLLRDAANHQRFCLTTGSSILNRVDGKWVAEFAVN